MGLVELAKVVCRLGIWGSLRGGMLRTCSPEEAQATVLASRMVQPDRLRPEFRRHADLVELYCNRGRTGPDSDQEAVRAGVHRFLQAEQHRRATSLAPREVLAELIHILRPLIYGGCRSIDRIRLQALVVREGVAAVVVVVGMPRLSFPSVETHAHQPPTVV